METKHTAGPWRVTQGIDQMADSGTTIYYRDGYGVYSDAETHGDAKADADLIGAAPALLKACRQALVALKGSEHDQFLRDAIALAEGPAA